MKTIVCRASAAALLCGSLGVLPAAASPAAPSVDEVLAASRAALGVGAVAKIGTVHMRGAVTIAGFRGTGDSWDDLRSGAWAQYADAGPVGGAQGYDGKVSWNRDTSGVVWDDASAGARYTAIDSAYLNRYALWMPGRGGAVVASEGRRTQGGHTDDVLRVTPPGSLPFALWFDASTHLPVRMVTVVGTSTTVTTMSDYRTVRGLRLAYTQTTDSDGNQASARMTAVTIDDPGADAALRRPETHVTDASLPSGTTTIPFELVDNHVALPVTIDGKGPFRFLFDTGGANFIDTDVAKQLGLGAAGTAAGGGVGAAQQAIQFATVDALGVGDATLRKQVFVVAPVHAGFGMSSGKAVDGLIGFEVLARFITTFDYANARIVLRTPEAAAPPALDAQRTIPFVFYGQHPMIACSIAGVSSQCVADTGSRIGLSILSPFLAAHPSIVPANATAPGANGFGVGGASIGRLARETLGIGGFTIPDVITDLSSQTKGAFADPFYGGNIGAAVWKRFTLTFDYPHRTMTLAPNAQLGVRETYDRSGTFLVAPGGKITVADVRPGTPAAAAGLLRGDVIATVGGKDAAAMGLAAIRDAFRGPDGTALALGVTGPGGARTVTLTLHDYV